MSVAWSLGPGIASDAKDTAMGEAESPLPSSQDSRARGRGGHKQKIITCLQL